MNVQRARNDVAFRYASERARKVARVLRSSSAADAYSALLNVGLEAPPLRETAWGNPGLEQDFCERVMGLEAQMMLSDQGQYLPDDLLTKVDRASMWESLEVRVPLLDHRVIEFSWALPTSMKFRGGSTKWPLRRIAERYVPRHVLERPKMGFTVPIARWLRGDWPASSRSTPNRRSPR